MQPEADEFKEWLGHPVTEWVFAMCRKQAGMMQTKWAELAWNDGVIDERALIEARVRADCYRALPDSSHDDWKAIDDSEA